MLEARRTCYVLWVASNYVVWVGFEQVQVDELLGGLATGAWVRRSWGDGAKGARVDEGVARQLTCPVAGWERWVLGRRSVAELDELAYSLVFVPSGTALADLVRVAGRRWTIEAAIEAAKAEVGLDQYDVRSWTSWYRHVTLALIAHASQVVTRATAAAAPEKVAGTERRGPSPLSTGSLAAFRQRRGLAG
jgi:hypothetical protein